MHAEWFIMYALYCFWRQEQLQEKKNKNKNKTKRTKTKQKQTKQNKQTSIERLRLFVNTRPHNRGKEMVYCTGFSSIYRIKILADLNNIL